MIRLIKPGKLIPLKQNGPNRRGPGGPEKKPIEVWDDFAIVKKPKKKKEFEKGQGDRMVARSRLFGPPPKELEENKENRAEGADAAAQEPIHHPTNFELLESKLGFEFKDKSLLERALTHRSALGFKERTDYERLEFLGDAVLDLSVAHLLSIAHPEAREGDLSKMRAALVNTQALANIARALDIGPFIRLGRGELASGGHERPSILADVMEAIFGAMYLDSTYDKALETVKAIFGDSLEKVTPSDPKTELQELLHAAGSEPPTYLLEMVEGPEHAPTFVAIVMVDGEIAGRGRGPTKKAAQQLAAAEALAKLTPSAPELELAEGQDAILTGALLISNNFQTTGY